MFWALPKALDCLSPQAQTRVNVLGELKHRTPTRFVQSVYSTVYAGCASLKGCFSFCTRYHSFGRQNRSWQISRSRIWQKDRKLFAPKACSHFVQQPGASVSSVASLTAIRGEASTSSTFKLLESWKMAGEAPDFRRDFAFIWSSHITCPFQK